MYCVYITHVTQLKHMVTKTNKFTNSEFCFIFSIFIWKFTVAYVMSIECAQGRISVAFFISAQVGTAISSSSSSSSQVLVPKTKPSVTIRDGVLIGNRLSALPSGSYAAVHGFLRGKVGQSKSSKKQTKKELLYCNFRCFIYVFVYLFVLIFFYFHSTTVSGLLDYYKQFILTVFV